MTNQIFIYHQLWWIPSAGNIVADEKRSLFLWSLYSGGERQIISETKSVQFKVLICYCCQWLSCVWLFVTPWTAACQASLSFTSSWSLLRFMSLELVTLCNHLILGCPLLLLPSVFPSIRVFSNESALCIRWPKYWSFSFSISPSNEYLGFISFRIDWFDLLAVQGTLKSLLQHHNLKASVLWHSAFFVAQLSHPYITTGKNIVLIICTFVNKVMSMLLNMLSRFVIVSLLRSKRFLISWLQSLSAVIFGGQEIKSFTASTFSLFAMKWWDRMPWS